MYFDRQATDRRSVAYEIETESKLDVIWGGVHTEASVQQIVEISHEFKKQHSNVCRFLQSKLIGSMFDLWRDEEAIDLAWENNTALSLGCEILEILDCENDDDFMLVVRKWDEFDPNGKNTELFLNIHDRSRSGIASFREFVLRCTTVKQKKVLSTEGVKSLEKS